MSLARTYATVFQELTTASQGNVVENLLAYMKKKGHLSVLPEMLRIVEREQKEQADSHIVVARESDVNKYRAEIDAVLKTIGKGSVERVSVDEAVVGGYSVRSGSAMVDTTVRSALVNIYQNAIS